MTNVFVSYSRLDKARVEPLVSFIDSVIGEVWWDDRFVAGESFTEETERRLNAADFVVVVWSPHSAHSKWVLDEAAVGRDAGKLLPVSFDGQIPPLGFRHVHTLDFSGWSGGAEDRCATALKAALLREPEKAPQTLAPKQAPQHHDQRSLHSMIVIGVLAIFGIAVIGGLTIGAITVLGDRESEPTIADVTADLIAGRAPDDPSTAGARKAVAELGASERAEEKAAFSSFAAGDQAHALGILEKLAADLERAGDKKAAAEAYTRVGAIALLIDQGRGLAARRKALDLAPDSLAAFQGLYFDIYRLQGYGASSGFAKDVIAQASTSDRMRGFAYAHLATSALAEAADIDLAEENFARVKALRDRANDPVLEAAVFWVTSVMEWRRDRLREAWAAIHALERANADFADPIFSAGPVVGRARVRFSEGDWTGAFAFGAEALNARRQAGQFLPTPVVNITCRTGLYTDQIEAAAPFCEVLRGRGDPNSGAGIRIYAAELAIARGDRDQARSEIAASRALAAADPALEADRLRVEAHIAAAGGDLDEAQSLLWRYLDLIADDPAAKSLRATSLRLFGLWAIGQGAPDRACAPLKESGALYETIGGRAGVDATAALRAAAKCP